MNADWQEEILKEWNKTKKNFSVSDGLRDRLAREFKGEVFYREPMDKHTSMRVGGPADVYLKPVDSDDLAKIFLLAREENIPITLMGAGSNTLVKDGGIRGLVIASPASTFECRIVEETDDFADVEAGAGVKITRFVNFAREKSLTGMENFIGIPGSIGGAISMNAGAHGTEIKDILRSLTLMDKEGQQVILSREKLDFEYRKLKIPRTSFILSGLFRLNKAHPDEINKKVEHFQKWRVEKQPLDYPNLGSVFKNPLPPKKGTKLPSAGELIEDAGLKNVRIGGARVSEKHANFIINENKATAKDVIVLINLIRDKVKDMTGIALETEVKIIGED